MHRTHSSIKSFQEIILIHMNLKMILKPGSQLLCIHSLSCRFDRSSSVLMASLSDDVGLFYHLVMSCYVMKKL